jgi:hypothetical protein
MFSSLFIPFILSKSLFHLNMSLYEKRELFHVLNKAVDMKIAENMQMSI